MEGLLLWIHALGMRIYGWVLTFADGILGHQQAGAWRQMRSTSTIAQWAPMQKSRSVIWIHCASLGEYEQARPVMKAIRESAPDFVFLLTFFSPSGFGPVSRRKPEFWKEDVDHLDALPLDTPSAVGAFLRPLKDKLALFAVVKYEVWPVLMQSLGEVPKAIFAAHIPPDHWLLRKHALLYQKAWKRFDLVAVQTLESVHTLRKIGVKHAQPLGDSRADRVLQIVQEAPAFDGLRHWCEPHFTIVAGSTWPVEEEALLETPPERLILVPHDLSSGHLEQIREQCRVHALKAIFTSEHGGPMACIPDPDVRVVVVDEMGWLAGLYSLANVAVVGGGWGVGIHNTLEPVAHGKPVITGPRIERFQEALQLKQLGALLVAREPRDISVLARDVPANMGSRGLNHLQGHEGAASRIAECLRTAL